MALIGNDPFSSLFAQLAIPQSQLMNAASQIPPFALPTLYSGFDGVSGQNLLFTNGAIAPFLSMPSPASMMGAMQPIAGGGYAQGFSMPPYNADNFLAGMMDPQRRDATQMARVLRSDPFARSAFEQALGGKIVDFGDTTGGPMAIQRFQSNPFINAMGGGALGPVASQIGNLYNQMNQGVVGGGGQNPFLPLALNGFTGMANQLLSAAPGGFDGYKGGVQGMAPLFGTGQASWNPLAQPGKIQGGNAAMEGAHSAQISSVLSDPSLSMEDKIMLSLMLVCSKMDDDIKRQTEYLNNLQNQQGARKGGGKAGGKAGGDAEKSIDLETKKLERMITKRSQLFDTLGKIMERYDQSAKNVIQAMRG